MLEYVPILAHVSIRIARDICAYRVPIDMRMLTRTKKKNQVLGLKT